MGAEDGADPRWQFWIDVGGTFTDVLARDPTGRLRRHKVLSSGRTKGSANEHSTQHCVLDSLRRQDPDQFWRGYRLRLISEQGETIEEGVVADFSSNPGAIRLATPMAAWVPGRAYELCGDEEAPLLGMRYLLGLPRDRPLPSAVVKLGTTKGTNALLTRTGVPCAFVTTRGFADILHIGYQNRPRLFELTIRKPAPLFVRTLEIDERMAADGTVLRAPDKAAVRAALQELRDQGVESLAICLLHAFRYPQHEQFVASVARDMGFREVSVSSEVAPFIKIVSRGDTTVADAYLNPVLRAYIERLREGMRGTQGCAAARPAAELRLLTSAGGLVPADRFRGKDSILSGPAGGVVGFSRVALAAGFSRAIGFDMGGTSTDVSRFDGRYEREYETEKAGVRIVAPMLAIETVAAGGGSLCWFDGIKLCVGPASAGADPGPACYGRGGPLSITDVNLYRGRLLPDEFAFPLDARAVESRLVELRDTVAAATGRSYELAELADGLLQLANARMAQAIRSVSIARGYDPRDYLLVPFGGAAGQHACAVARELEIARVLCHPDAGLLSAFGIGLADVTRHRAVGWYRRFEPAVLPELAHTIAELSREAQSELVQEGVAAERVSLVPALDLRYLGTDVPLTIVAPDDGDYAAAFARQHQRLYGYVQPQRPLEVVAVRVDAVG
ncbi:MAG: hydantoinase/oxoprolinase family protein, partial [Pirellulaceae bacterium]